jgi:hypothetical protein
LTIGALAIAIGVFARNNRLGQAAGEIVPGLIFPGLAIFVGSLATVIMLMRPAAARAAPYALAVASIVAIDVAATMVLPRAEAYKPIPRLAAIIERERRPGDVVGIQNISGGNALIFYTYPPVAVLAPRAAAGDPAQEGEDPRTFVCGTTRVWVVGRRGSAVREPTFGRERRLIASDQNAVLLLYDGPSCAMRGSLTKHPPA